MPRTINDNIAVFDIDGCISDDVWRRARIPEGAEHSLQYEYYHAGCSDDPPLAIGSEVLRTHIARGDFIVFCTARPMKVSGETSKWISDHFGISPDGDFVILMRGDGDNRSAVEVKREMASFLRGFEDQTKRKVIAAYDDRQDIVDMYRENGYIAQLLDANGLTPLAPGASFLPEADAALQKPLKLLGVAEILEEAAQTFRERNAVYRDNAVKVGDLMAVLFPHGVTLRTAKDHRAYHLFELMIVKLTRFVNSDLRHQDSIRDLAVYAAMVESLVDQHEIEVRDEWSE